MLYGNRPAQTWAPGVVRHLTFSCMARCRCELSPQLGQGWSWTGVVGIPGAVKGSPVAALGEGRGSSIWYSVTRRGRGALRVSDQASGGFETATASCYERLEGRVTAPEGAMAL